MNTLMVIIFGIFLPLLMGYGIILLIFRKKEIRLSIYEMLSLSLGLGIGILTLYMFLLGVLGIDFGLWSISSIYLLALPNAIYQLWARRKHKMYCFQKVDYTLPKKSWIKWILIVSGILILRNIFSTFFVVLGTPTYPDDSTTNRNFRAKVVYHTQSLNLDKPDNLRLFNAGTYNNYPLFNSFYKAYIGFSMGNYDDRATNILSPLCGLLVMLLIFGFFLRRQNLMNGIIGVALYCMIPMMWIQSINTYAEPGVMLYTIATILLVIEYLGHNNRKILLVGGLMAAMLGWLKNEGLIAFFSGILAALALVKIILLIKDKYDIRKAIKDILIFAIPTVIFFVLWKLFLSHYGMTIGSGSQEVMKGTFSLSYHPEIWPAFIQVIFKFGGFNILPIIFITSLCVFWKKIIENKILWFLVFAIIFIVCVLFAVWLFTPNYEAILHGDSRQLWIIMVIIIIFLLLLSHDNNKIENSENV